MHLAVFTYAGFDRIEGTSYVYLKTSKPGSGLAFVAQRIKSAAAAAGQNAPGTGKAIPVNDETDAMQSTMDQARARFSQKSAVMASPEVLEMAIKMQVSLDDAARR